MHTPTIQKNRSIPLLILLCLFTVTFFIYRDFGIRMLFGFGVLGLLLAAALLQRAMQDRPLQPRSADGAFAVLAVVILVNFLRPDSRHDTDSASYVIAMLICTAFVWLHTPDAAEDRRSLQLLWWGAVFMAAFSLFFTMNKELFYSLIYPRLSQVARNYLDYFVPMRYGIALGGYTFADYVLFAGIAVCFGWMVQSRQLWKRLLLLGCAAIFLFVILSLGRRGEFLAAVACCGIMLLILCNRRQRIAILLGGCALLTLALWLFFRYLPQLREIDIFYRYVRTVENLLTGQDFTSGRTALFALAIDGFRSAPIFGIGFDQFVTLVNPLLTDIEGNTISDAHNIYLQMLCETGIVGTVLTLLPLGYIFVTTCRMLRRAKALEDREPLSLTIVSFLIQLNLLVLGLYDPSFQKIVFWCFYALAVMLLRSAMARSGWNPTGPVTRLFEGLIALLTPAGRWLWGLLRTPWKEGK